MAEQKGISAQQCLDMVRDRAFGDTNHRVAVNKQNIINENHYEFVGEGHRYYDVVRWGITEVLNVDNVPGINSARTWNLTINTWLFRKVILMLLRELNLN